MEKTDSVTFHIISHTHWDREWYLPFEVFRIELVELIDNLLNILKHNKDFIFHLDGQTIMLSDYLEIKPYKKEEIKKYIEEGRLQIGPWYVLSDQFLTSGEATIRNLLFGIRDAKSFGHVMNIGYCPDQFGQIAQLPQILKGFNIDSIILGRGIQDSKEEHIWFGLNGESVLAVSLTHWYNNAQRLPEENEKLHKYLNKIYDTQFKTSISKHILLMNGCDHLVAQENLPKILKSLNGNNKWNIKHDSLTDVIKAIDMHPNKTHYPIYFGELREDNNKYILAGTLSSRVYLKLENYKCQTKLEKIVEPLAVLLSLNNICEYPQDFINYAWRLLIQNHAHDSICGCSTDEVHREMEVRFLKVSQVLDKLQENLLSTLNTSTHQYINTSAHQYLQLINLTNYHRSETIEADLEFPLGPPAEHASAIPTMNKKEITNLCFTCGDEKIESEIIENQNTFTMIRSKDEVPLLQAIQKIKILLKADIEPWSIKSYEIIEDRNIRTSGHQHISTTLSFENPHYQLTINKDGTLSILPPTKWARLALSGGNSQFFNSLHFLTIEDDLGDEYNFVPNPNSSIITSTSYKWQIQRIEENTLRTRFLISTNEIPNIEYVCEMTCYKDSKRIDFKTKINNKCKNKRIRLHFPTNLNTNSMLCDTAFGVIERARPPVTWVNYATSQPIHNWIYHRDGENGLAFFGNGLADYELYEDGNGFAVTLIRSVGRLSTVKSHSLIETSEAQCNREIEFHYAIYPHEGNHLDLPKEQLIYQCPILYNKSQVQLDILNQINVLSNPELMISSLKLSEDKKDLYILRIYNPHNKKVQNCKLTLGFKIKNIYLLNLNEEVQKTFNDVKDVTFEVAPYQIFTFGFEKQ